MENDGYDIILHKISQYDTIRFQNAPPYVITAWCYLHSIYTITVNSPRLKYSSFLTDAFTSLTLCHYSAYSETVIRKDIGLINA